MQANNYAVFYDASRQGWSILFESQQIAHKFGKEVIIMKCLFMNIFLLLPFHSGENINLSLVHLGT